MFANVAWDHLYSINQSINLFCHTLFALAFDNGLADRKFAFKKFNGNNQATSGPNFVNFRRLISEFTLLKRTIFAAIRSQFDNYLHSSRWHFQTDWKIALLISAEYRQSFLYTL